MKITKEQTEDLRSQYVAFAENCTDTSKFPTLYRIHRMLDLTVDNFDTYSEKELDSMQRVVVGAMTKPWKKDRAVPATNEEVENYYNTMKA